jgi:hypothetical protein
VKFRMKMPGQISLRIATYPSGEQHPGRRRPR